MKMTPLYSKENVTPVKAIKGESPEITKRKKAARELNTDSHK